MFNKLKNLKSSKEKVTKANKTNNKPTKTTLSKITSNRFKTTNKKYLTYSIISFIFIISLIPIITNIKQNSKSNAEQTGTSPNNSKLSKIKQIYNDLITLGTNFGTGTNLWNKIETSAKWTPNDATLTPDKVPCNLTYYAGNNRTKKVGTKNCPPGQDGNNTRGGDIYIKGQNFTTSTIGQVGNTNCQSTKYISSTKIRCTIPPKPHNTTQLVTVANNGTANPNQKVTYNNNSQGTFQAFTKTNCQNLQRGQALVLTDSRNNQTYRIKKMPDNKCWMIDNLRYAHSSWIQPVLGQYMTKDGKYPSDGLGWNDNELNVYRYRRPGISNASTGCSPGSNTSTCYGYLYNWYTATNGTGKYSTSANTNVNGNICPNNSSSGNTGTNLTWNLPTGGGDYDSSNMQSTDYAILNTAMRDDNENNTFATGQAASSHSSHLNDSTYNPAWQPTSSFQGTFSGLYDTSLNYQASSGYYWSSTAYSDDSARLLYFNSSNVGPGSNYGDKNLGFAVRCVVH